MYSLLSNVNTFYRPIDVLLPQYGYATLMHGVLPITAADIRTEYLAFDDRVEEEVFGIAPASCEFKHFELLYIPAIEGAIGLPFFEIQVGDRFVGSKDEGFIESFRRVSFHLDHSMFGERFTLRRVTDAPQDTLVGDALVLLVGVNMQAIETRAVVP